MKNLMRKTSGLIVLLLTCAISCAQVIQRGRVVEYHGHEAKTPIAGVQIIAAGDADVSDENGYFKLEIAFLKQGDPLLFDRIYKSGYIVFNKDAVSACLINCNRVFEIVLCKKSDYDHLVSTYYNVSFNSYHKQYLAEQAKAKRLLEDGKILQEQYNQRIKEAQLLYERALQQLNTHAEAMARIDLSQLSEIENQALQYAQSGDIETAIELMESIDFSSKIDSLRGQQDYGKELQHQGKVIVAEAESERVELLSRVSTIVSLYVTSKDEASALKCVSMLNRIIELNPFSSHEEATQFYSNILLLLQGEKENAAYKEIILHIQNEL